MGREGAEERKGKMDGKGSREERGREGNGKGGVQRGEERRGKIGKERGICRTNVKLHVSYVPAPLAKCPLIG